MTNILTDIVDSIFKPSTKPQRGLVLAMNASFYGLFLTLFGMAILTSWNIHVLALLAISILLFGSIQWFINELGQIEVQKAQQDNVKAGKENGAPDPLSAEGASAMRIGNTTSRQDAPGNSAVTERRANMASDE